jgi:hypothetical protein
MKTSLIKFEHFWGRLQNPMCCYLGDFPSFKGKGTIPKKVLLPQVLMEFHSISHIKGKNSITGGIVIYNSLKLDLGSMVKFIKGGACKLQLSQVKFKLYELSPSSNLG